MMDATNVQDEADETLLEDEPIKIRWTGKARRRIKGYNQDFDSVESDRFVRALSWQKTNIVIETVEEATAVASEMSKYSGAQRSWMNASMDRALARVQSEIVEEMGERGFDAKRGSVGRVTGFEKKELATDGGVDTDEDDEYDVGEMNLHDIAHTDTPNKVKLEYILDEIQEDGEDKDEDESHDVERGDEIAVDGVRASRNPMTVRLVYNDGTIKAIDQFDGIYEVRAEDVTGRVDVVNGDNRTPDEIVADGGYETLGYCISCVTSVPTSAQHSAGYECAGCGGDFGAGDLRTHGWEYDSSRGVWVAKAVTDGGRERMYEIRATDGEDDVYVGEQSDLGDASLKAVGMQEQSETLMYYVKPMSQESEDDRDAELAVED